VAWVIAPVCAVSGHQIGIASSISGGKLSSCSSRIQDWLTCSYPQLHKRSSAKRMERAGKRQVSSSDVPAQSTR
jgi:hypothetical protein